MKRVQFITMLVLLLAAAALVEVALAGMKAGSETMAAAGVARPLAQTEIGIQSTERISVPFGIEPVLPLYDEGERVAVTGHGACTGGETVTVTVTVTQATGAIAMGTTQETCTGLEQQWSLMAELTNETPLEVGEAEACGLAVTQAEEEITDTFDWCRDVHLAEPHFLPIIFHEASGLGEEETP